MDVIVTKAGDTAPSVKPKRNLTAAKPAKFLGAARHMHTMPQRTTVTPTNLVRGSFDIR
jgi:hypothetical protein